MIRENLLSIKNELPSGVKLVAVSKFHPIGDILQAYDAGQRVFGENRPQELLAKVSELSAQAGERTSSGISWDISRRTSSSWSCPSRLWSSPWTACIFSKP